MRMIGCVSPVDRRHAPGARPRPGRRRLRQIRARLGVVPAGGHARPGAHRPRNLLVYGRYFGLPRRSIRRAGRRAARLRAAHRPRATTKVDPLSGGMKRRLTIARTLINEPEVLLLDEPTTGLDPQARHVLWDRLYRLKQHGVTLILTTHYMDEAEQLCDRLVVMDKARIVAEGSPAELIDQWSTPRGGRAPLPARRARAHGRQARGPGRAGRGAAGPAAALHRRRRRRRSAVHERGLRPVGVAGPPVHAGGRLPAAHRPDAGGLSDQPPALALRSFEYWLFQYKRTWRGRVVSTVLFPVLFLAAMGVGLGTLVDSSASGERRGPPTSSSSLRGCWPRRAMQTGVGESTYPVMGAIKWVKTYHAMLADAARRADVLVGHLLYIGAPDPARLGDLPGRDGGVRRGGQPAGAAAVPAAAADRAGVRDAGGGVRGDHGERQRLRVPAAVRDRCRCSCSAACSSR